MATPGGPARLEYAGIEIQQQPDDVSCGPTCLQGIYRYHGHDVSLDDVMASVPKLDHGGTLGATLGLDAIRRGFSAALLTYNLQVFDPSWFPSPRDRLVDLLSQQLEYKREARFVATAEAYRDFLAEGGVVQHRELSPGLLAKLVRGGAPPLVGLSATYLYGCARCAHRGRW